MWLEDSALAESIPGFRPRCSPPGLAIEAWNLMGGLQWEALPVVCELLGVDDPETLIRQLVAIRAREAKLNGE